jgi:cellulose synthase/poly-beta-1,6-N-acetylglucosamine synthase-like glycosyltransferase
MAKPLFWISTAALLYTFIGYPLLVWALARLRARKAVKARITPRASVVLACHDEADKIEARLTNLLQCDYPREQLEIIVVSDGSTDGTAEIAARHKSDRVRVLDYADRRGKAAALNCGVAEATGEIVVFADARQSFDPGAIRELASSFADMSVGAVSGKYVLAESNGSTVREGIGLYWQYEEWIRRSESSFNSVVGATGAIYAIRRGLWRPLPEGTILDDVYTPMQIALSGYRVILDERARAFDRAPDSAAREFSRKVRTLTGNYQLCQLLPRLLAPTTALAFQFYSHKLMRLAAPLFFLLLLATSIALAARPGALFYKFALAAQMIFYACVLAGGYLLKRNRKVRLLNFAYVFSVMNAAALVGLFYFIFGKRNIWARVK